MVVVAILGILAALAIPAFTSYVRRSKTSEASENLNAIFKAAAAHYGKEVTVGPDAMGMDAQVATGCITPSTLTYDPAMPKAEKQRFAGTDDAWKLLNFHIADYVYFSYALFSVTDQPVCYNTQTDIDNLYTFAAQGDLDEDTTMSTFELAAGIDKDGELYHARGLYIANEIE